MKEVEHIDILGRGKTKQYQGLVFVRANKQANKQVVHFVTVRAGARAIGLG